MSIPPSGEQHELSWEDHRAVVVEVGGGVRLYEVGGRSVLDAYEVDAICDGAHGTPLIPWPNRLADGRYSFEDEDYRLPLDEPEKANAIHGLLRWRNWEGERRSEAEVVMSSFLHPMQGYPFSLSVSISYSLSAEGLRVTTSARNEGPEPLPYGVGQHPYLSPGAGLIDDCNLELRAGRRILTDDTRQLPKGDAAVSGTEYDFSRPRPIGQLELDYPFFELARDDDGLAWVRLGGSDGRTVALWVDEHYPIIELYSGDTLAPERQRRGLGAEPMSCPPNAFQSGEGVIKLAPGEEVTTAWGVRLV